MKKLMMLMVAVVTAMTLTLIPQKAVAANAVVDVLTVVAVVALVAIEIDQMNKCYDGQYQYCDYYDYNNCQYQTITRHEVIESCNTYGRYSSYQCVRSQNSSTVYIKSCSGFNANYNYHN